MVIARLKIDEGLDLNNSGTVDFPYARQHDVRL